MKKASIFIITLLIMIPSVVCAGELKITNYNSKAQGDCVLLESKGEYLLMDTCIEAEENQLISWLKANNVNNLSLYISHYHADHTGLILPIINDEAFTIDKVYVPTLEAITPYATEEYKSTNADNWKSMNAAVVTYNSIKNKEEEKNYEMVELQKGSSFQIGDATVTIVGPTKKFTMEEFTDENAVGHFFNNLSLVALVKVDDVTYFTAGDMEKESEASLLASSTNVKADILKINHHGLNTGTTEALINAIKPTYAFYTYEEETYNSNDLIKEQVTNVEKWANVYSRGYNGTTVFTIKDNEISVSAEKNVSHVTIDSVDQDKKSMHKQTIDFNKESPMYIKGYQLDLSNYKYIKDNIEEANGKKPSADNLTYTVEYQLLHLNATHNYKENSEEEKIIQRIETYLETDENVKLNQIDNWTMESVEYVQTIGNAKRYFVKSNYTCTEVGNDCMGQGTKTENGSYQWNFYVLDEEVIKLGTTSDTSAVEIVETKTLKAAAKNDEIENPNTGSFLNIIYVLISGVIIVGIFLKTRKKAIFKLR